MPTFDLNIVNRTKIPKLRKEIETVFSTGSGGNYDFQTKKEGFDVIAESKTKLLNTIKTLFSTYTLYKFSGTGQYNLTGVGPNTLFCILSDKEPVNSDFNTCFSGNISHSLNGITRETFSSRVKNDIWQPV